MKRKGALGVGNIDKSKAELIAAKALAFVVGQEELLQRFMALTGLGPDLLRDKIRDPALHAGALSFLLEHEPDAAAFSVFAELDPGQAGQALFCFAHDSEDLASENDHD